MCWTESVPRDNGALVNLPLSSSLLTFSTELNQFPNLVSFAAVAVLFFCFFFRAAIEVLSIPKLKSNQQNVSIACTRHSPTSGRLSLDTAVCDTLSRCL
jgi:hypothetical protein